MKVLISLLGLSPGVATGAYYALYHGWGIEESIQVDKVVTLGTNAPGMDRFEDEIIREFDRWQWEMGLQVQYDNTCRLNIEAEDLNDEDSVDEFQGLLIQLLRDYRNDEVYMVVASGSKSMAALAAIAVQLFGHGVRGMYHLYVDKGLEEDGSPDRFWVIDLDRRREVMRPPKDQCRLVEVPFIFIREDDTLDFRGEVDADLAQALEARFDVLDERGREKYWDYIFEVKTADYVREQAPKQQRYPVTKPNYRHPDLPVECKELDVYAEFSHEKFEKRLVVECKLRHIPNPNDKPVDVGAVEQVIRRLEALRIVLAPQIEKQGKELRLEGWVVCNANAATSEAWQRAQQAGVQLLWADLPRNWRTGPRDWQIVRLVPIPLGRED